MVIKYITFAVTTKTELRLQIMEGCIRYEREFTNVEGIGIPLNGGVLVTGLGYKDVFDGNYEEAKGYALWGKVVVVGKIDVVNVMFSQAVRVGGDLEVGDRVMIKWYEVGRSLSAGRVGILEVDGVDEDVYWVGYEHLILRERDGVQELLNGNVLVEVDERLDVTNVGVVTKVGKDVLGYLEYRDNLNVLAGLEFSPLKIKVDDKVVISGRAAVPVDYHMDMMEYIVQERNIILIVEKDVEVELQQK